MSKIAAHALAVGECVVSRAGHVGMRIAEGNVVVHEIDDGLHQTPTLWNAAEGRPGETG